MALNRAVLTESAVEDPQTEQPADFNAMLDALKVNVIVNTFELAEIEVIGLDAPIANAIRRILLAEVPAMAIEHVYLDQNTSVIPDEILAHRLGLIPIRADPRRFKFRKGEEEHDDSNSLSFRLHAKCPIDQAVLTVYSGDLKWEPVGEQSLTMPEVGLVHDDIIIAKLGRGQEIEAELVAEKGTGQTHAKWSPVCTASYRLMPSIELKTQVTGEKAESLVGCCPTKVFDLEDSVALVSRPRDCTSCRECVRLHSDVISLAKIKNHFIYTIESVGALPAITLFSEAVKVLRSKCEFWTHAVARG